MSDYLSKNGLILSVDENGKTTSLKEAVGILAMATFDDFVEMTHVSEADEKKRLEQKISAQSNLIETLSTALFAINSSKQGFE